MLMAASEQECLQTVRFEQATSEANPVEKLKQEHFSKKAVVYILFHTWSM